MTVFLKNSLISQWTLQESKKKKLQKEVYFKREMMIHVTRTERLVNNMEDSKRKEFGVGERESGQGN